MADIKVGIQITADSQDAALLELITKMKAAQTELKTTGKTAEESAEKFSGLKGALKEVAQSIAGLFALGAITNFLREGARAAADKERALIQLGNTVRQFGGNAEDAAGKAEALASALQKKGFNDDEVIVGIRNVTTQTHDYEQALWAASLAADMSAKTGKSYGESLDLLQGLMAGKQRSVVQAHKDFGTTATTVQGNIDELDKLFSGYASTLNDTKSKLEAAKQELDDFGKLLGGPVNETILFIVKAFKSLGIAISGVGLGAYYAADLTLTSWSATYKALSGIDWKHPWNSLKAGGDEVLAETKAKLAEAKAAFSAWADQSSDILGGQSPIPSGGKKGVAMPSASGSGGQGPSPAAKAALDLAGAIRDLRAAETQEAMTAFDNAEGKRAMAEAAKRLIAALEAEKEAAKGALEVERSQKLADAKGDRAAILAINQQYDAKQLTLDAQYQQKLDALDQRHLQRISAIGDKITAAKKRDEDKQFQDAQRNADRLEKLEQDRQQKIQHWNQVRVTAERSLYNQLIGLAGQYGGKSLQTIVQVAQAIQQFYDLWQTIQTIFFAKKQVEEATAAVTSQVTAKATGIVNTTTAAYEYATNAAASVAAIPFAGWAMAPAVYAEALATGLTGVGVIAGLPIAAMAKGGLALGPTMALIGEAGVPEAVLPANLTRLLLRAAEGQGGGSSSTTYNTRQRGGDVYVTQHLLTGAHADYAFRELDRKLRTARRSNDRALASPRRVRVGSARRVN